MRNSAVQWDLVAAAFSILWATAMLYAKGHIKGMFQNLLARTQNPALRDLCNEHIRNIEPGLRFCAIMFYAAGIALIILALLTGTGVIAPPPD